jgi:hypothetical protein
MNKRKNHLIRTPSIWSKISRAIDRIERERARERETGGERETELERDRKRERVRER